MGLAPVLLASIHYARNVSASNCNIACEQYHTYVHTHTHTHTHTFWKQLTFDTMKQHPEISRAASPETCMSCTHACTHRTSPSINTFIASLIMFRVEMSTNMEKKNVHIGSAICHSGYSE